VTAAVLSAFTVAVNCCVAAADTVTEPGATLTVDGLPMVTEADDDADVSACETAVTLTVAGLGTVAGAVYSPPEETVPTEELPPAVPFTCQVTAVLVALATVAENCCSAPAPTAADVGNMVTVTSGPEGVFLLLPQLRSRRVRLAISARACLNNPPRASIIILPALMRFDSPAMGLSHISRRPNSRMPPSRGGHRCRLPMLNTLLLVFGIAATYSEGVPGPLIPRAPRPLKVWQNSREMQTERGRQICRRHGPVAEFSNLWLKVKLGLRQFRLRDLKKVRCEALWASLTYSLQKGPG
jgi:hypothetical protein